MSWDAARAALDARFLTLAGLDPTHVAWPNKVFPASGQVMPTDFWKIDLLPSGVDPTNSGADHERGIYQVSRWVPAGVGIGSALRDAQAVVDLFKRQVISGISVNVPSIAPPLQEADWLHIPISIAFQVL